MNTPEPGCPILLYDGVCGLCNRLNQFLLSRDRAGRLQFAALQSAFADQTLRKHGKKGDLDTLYLLTDYGCDSERVLSKSRAVLGAVEELGGPWRALAGVLRALPARILDAVYDRVARNRYRIFGKSETCRVPTPEQRARFIEFE